MEKQYAVPGIVPNTDLIQVFVFTPFLAHRPHRYRQGARYGPWVPAVSGLELRAEPGDVGPCRLH